MKHNSHTFAPHSLLGVFLVNVLVHMYLLIGGVGVHWYCIRSKTGAGIDCSRVLPAINGHMECACMCICIESSEWYVPSEATVCPHLLPVSFLAILTVPITIPSTSSVARTPKTVPPTKPPMVGAVADCSCVGSGWTTAGILYRVTEWRCNV